MPAGPPWTCRGQTEGESDVFCPRRILGTPSCNHPKFPFMHQQRRLPPGSRDNRLVQPPSRATRRHRTLREEQRARSVPQPTPSHVGFGRRGCLHSLSSKMHALTVFNWWSTLHSHLQQKFKKPHFNEFLLAGILQVSGESHMAWAEKRYFCRFRGEVNQPPRLLWWLRADRFLCSFLIRSR